MDATDVERLARLEAQVENMTKMLASINDKLDIWNQNYVPRTEINEMFRARDEDIKDKASRDEVGALNKRLDTVETEKWSWRQMWPAWIGILLSGLAFIAPYLK